MENKVLFAESGNKYTVEKFINNGAFGDVFQVRGKRNRYAMKMFIAARFDPSEKPFDVEAYVMEIAEQNNIKELVQSVEIGILLDHPEKYASQFIAMELLGMSLYQMQCELTLEGKDGKPFASNAFSYENIKSFGLQIAKAMDFLHRFNILHLDLKPENIFLVSRGNSISLNGVDKETAILSLEDTKIKVGDYGGSMILDDGVDGYHGTVQTPNYRALEVFLGQKYTRKSDVWSFGCMMTEFYTGSLLFYGSTTEEGHGNDEEIQLDVIERAMRRRIPQSMLEAAFNERTLNTMENKVLFAESGNKYTVEKFINNGAFGDVFQVRGKRNRYAMKMFIAARFDPSEKPFDVEAYVMEIAEQNNIKELVQSVEIGILLDHPEKYASQFIAMELLGMSLYQMQCELTLEGKDGKPFASNAFSYENIKSFGLQIAKAMDFLHRFNILHLDLKPENIFLVSRGNSISLNGVDKETAILSLEDTKIKVGDYGGSMILDDGVDGYHGTVQTPNYRALEVFLGQKYTRKSDVWSFGCMMTEFYTGSLLFYGSTTEEGHGNDEEIQLDVIERAMRRRIPQSMLEAAFNERSKKVIRTKDGTYAFHKELKTPAETVKNLSDYIRKKDKESAVHLFSLIIQCLMYNPLHRPGFDDILKKPLFEGM